MSETKITVTENAPYKIEGDFLIIGTNSLAAPKSPCYLCSCGQSENKPYCDGSHTKERYVTVNIDELKPLDGTRNVQIKY